MPKQSKPKPTGLPPRPNKADFLCMVESGAIEGTARQSIKNECPIIRQRLYDILIGIGIGLFIGFIADLLFDLWRLYF